MAVAGSRKIFSSTSKLYGRSDVQGVFGTPAGHTHTNLKRELAPGFGVDDRSLPIIDCAECETFLLRDGWARHPSKVEKTSDELEYEERSKAEGDMYAREMSRRLGEMLAGQIERKSPVG